MEVPILNNMNQKSPVVYLNRRFLLTSSEPFDFKAVELFVQKFPTIWGHYFVVLILLDLWLDFVV
jgi:hypothetical protein